MIPIPPLVLQLLALVPITLILIPTLLFTDDGGNEEQGSRRSSTTSNGTDSHPTIDDDVLVNAQQEMRSMWIPFSFTGAAKPYASFCRKICRPCTIVLKRCRRCCGRDRRTEDGRFLYRSHSAVNFVVKTDNILRFDKFSKRSKKNDAENSQGKFSLFGDRSISPKHDRLPPPHTASTPQILSDVDDTFICSGAGWKGGSDRRFRPHVVYPGAASFYLALSRGIGDSIDPEGVIWMSARAAHTPIINYFAGEIDDRHPIGQALVKEGRKVGCLGFGTKGGLYGKFRHNMTFSRENRNLLKGEHKFLNFVNYMKATPFILPKRRHRAATQGLLDDKEENDDSLKMSRATSGIALAEMVQNDKKLRGVRRFFSCDGCECQAGVENEKQPTGIYIFLGDNGEGDQRTAIRLLESHPEKVAACFIQDVTGMGYGQNHQAPHLMSQGKLFYFTTYLGAAIQAFRAGLITRSSLARVYGEIVQSPFMLEARKIFEREARAKKLASASKTTADAKRVETSTTTSGEASSEMAPRQRPLFVSPQRDAAKPFRPIPGGVSFDTNDLEGNAKVGRDFGTWCEQIRADLEIYEDLRKSIVASSRRHYAYG